MRRLLCPPRPQLHLASGVLFAERQRLLGLAAKHAHVGPCAALCYKFVFSPDKPVSAHVPLASQDIALCTPKYFVGFLQVQHARVWFAAAAYVF